MCGVFAPVIGVLPSQFRAAQNEQVFGVVFFGGRCEIEGAGDNGLAVHDHDLVVRDGVLRVNQRGDAFMRQKIGRRILGGHVAFVEDRAHVHAALVGVHQRSRDFLGRKTVRLHQDVRLGCVQFGAHGGGASTGWREVDSDGGGVHAVCWRDSGKAKSE